MSACPYSAIIHQERPCAKACGMNAIHSDEHGRADIDQDKCVSCGMCLVSCPVQRNCGQGPDLPDHSGDQQRRRRSMPSWHRQWQDQFGPDMKPEKIRPAFQALGFKDVVEVAVGADLVYH